MGFYYPRNIARLAYYKGRVNANQTLNDIITFDASYSKPRVLKMQLTVDVPCRVKINEHSTVLVDNNYGLIIDYTDLIIDSLEFLDPADIYIVVGY